MIDDPLGNARYENASASGLAFPHIQLASVETRCEDSAPTTCVGDAATESTDDIYSQWWRIAVWSHAGSGQVLDTDNWDSIYDHDRPLIASLNIWTDGRSCVI